MKGLLAFAVVATGCRLNFDDLTAGDANGAGMIDGASPTCTGHDEDGDGYPDGCDVCPSVPDPQQLDRSEILAGNAADGVGDACDPRPSLAGDYILVFDAHANSATSTYVLSGPTSWQPDALRLGAVTGVAGDANFMLPSLPTRLETRMHIVDASTTTTHWFGIWYSADSSQTTMVFAEAANNPTDATNIEMDVKEQNGAAQRFSTFLFGPPVFSAGQTYAMVADTSLLTGGDDVLTVTDPVGGTRTTNLSIQIPRDVYGLLEGEDVIIDFDYFIAYGIR